MKKRWYLYLIMWIVVCWAVNFLSALSDYSPRLAESYKRSTTNFGNTNEIPEMLSLFPFYYVREQKSAEEEKKISQGDIEKDVMETIRTGQAAQIVDKLEGWVRTFPETDLFNLPHYTSSQSVLMIYDVRYIASFIKLTVNSIVRDNNLLNSIKLRKIAALYRITQALAANYKVKSIAGRLLDHRVWLDVKVSVLEEAVYFVSGLKAPVSEEEINALSLLVKYTDLEIGIEKYLNSRFAQAARVCDGYTGTRNFFEYDRKTIKDRMVGKSLECALTLLDMQIGDMKKMADEDVKAFRASKKVIYQKSDYDIGIQVDYSTGTTENRRMMNDFLFFLKTCASAFVPYGFFLSAGDTIVRLALKGEDLSPKTDLLLYDRLNTQKNALKSALSQRH